ncbi:MAG: nucleoside deaminase [Oscillospiraceae bacterium]|jgi:tRNA(adenine34) deaminase|nr:nucleoside deaminase [Oscillospiraceae bacterium]
MGRALALAERAAAAGEVPVGCVVTRGGVVVGQGFNRRETERRALAHAELLAIDEACRALHGWRLHGCDLYVTLEPCPMCAGAILNARLARVFFGAADPTAGAMGSRFDLFALGFNHRPEAQGGLLADRSAALLSAFFAARRKRGGSP